MSIEVTEEEHKAICGAPWWHWSAYLTESGERTGEDPVCRECDRVVIGGSAHVEAFEKEFAGLFGGEGK